MRIYCRNCWRDYPMETIRCPTCGADLHGTTTEDYVTELIRALRHPEPMTAERAAILLGKIGDPRAAEPLLSLLTEPVAAAAS